MATHYPSEGRDNNFLVIRLVAATAVVLTHSYSIVTGRFESEPLVIDLQRSIGHYAVDLFFVLSGFLVTQSLFRNPDLIRYGFARVFRIFPGLITAVLATALILGPLITDRSFSAYISDPQLLKTIMGALSTLWVDGALPGVFGGVPEAGNVNEPLWTLKYELTAYLSLALVAFVVARAGKWGAVLIPLAGLVLYAYGRAQIPWPQSDSTLNNMLHLLLVFYFGAGAFLLRKSIPLTLPGLVAVWGTAWLVHDTQFREISELVAIGYTFLWVSFVPNLGRKALSGGWDYSFGIYIYAYPIQQTLRQALPEIMPLELFALSMVFVIPVAAASWHLVEKPSLRLGRFTLERFNSWRSGSKSVAAAP